MKHDRTSEFWHSIAQFLLGGMGLVVLTLACARLGISLAATGFAYLTS
jgi:hypothetical protein